MDDDTGATKDDVKIPDGECGDKIKKLFTDEGKDVSMWKSEKPGFDSKLTNLQTSLSSPLWVKRLPLTARKPPNKRQKSYNVTKFTTLGSFALQRHGCKSLYDAPYHLVATRLSTFENRQKYHARMRNGVFCKRVGFTPLEMLDIVDGLAHDTWHEMKLASNNVTPL